MKQENKKQPFKKNCEDEEMETCNCGCADGKECKCGDDCKCGDSCTCHNDKKEKSESKCCCHENESEEEHCQCGCDEDCECHNTNLAGEYLAMAQRLQADFDNYRKRVAEQLDYQREEGKKSVIEVFLPCLDTFKEAKKSISDESVLAGVNMIEEKILKALKSLNVEKIKSIGEKYDHNLHEVVAVFADESKENDIILDEFQAGYTMNGKVIRYSKVIVNKKGE